MKLKDIPADFHTGGRKPIVVKTVGQLKKQLARLPDNLPLQGDFGHSVEMVVYNYETPEVHLAFEPFETA